MPAEVVYVGGPCHGVREVRKEDVLSLPKQICFPTYSLPSQQYGEACYQRAELADTPGAIAYVFESSRTLLAGGDDAR